MTKHSMEVLDKKNNEWTPVALFSDIVPIDALNKMCNAMWDCVEGAAQVAVIDMNTGEVVAENDAEVWDEGDECDGICDLCPCGDECIDTHPFESSFNEDMGFDPYLGCYTDDC